jgi:hypothetical protein
VKYVLGETKKAFPDNSEKAFCMRQIKIIRYIKSLQSFAHNDNNTYKNLQAEE